MYGRKWISEKKKKKKQTIKTRNDASVLKVFKEENDKNLTRQMYECSGKKCGEEKDEVEQAAEGLSWIAGGIQYRRQSKRERGREEERRHLLPL